MKTIFDINEQIVNGLHFSSGLWLLIGAILFALLCLCFLLTTRNGRVKPRTVLVEFGWLSLAYFILYGLGFLTCDSHLLKEPLWKPQMPVLFIVISAAVILFLCSLYFFKRRKRFADFVSATAIRRSAAGSGAAKYAYALLFAGMLLSTILCGIRFGCGDSFIHLLVPMATVTLVLLLYLLTHWNFWYLIGGVFLLAYAVLVIQAELVETQYTFAPLLALIPLYLSSILPLLSLGTQKR
jgi:hypothetical protein